MSFRRAWLVKNYKIAEDDDEQEYIMILEEPKEWFYEDVIPIVWAKLEE